MTKIFCSTLALALVAYAGEVSASHKAWLLKNYASECNFAVPLANDNSPIFEGAPIKNTFNVTRVAVCPVALAGRWGSSSYQLFPPQLWAAARSAVAWVRNSVSSNVSCTTHMQVQTGAFYYSQSATASGQSAMQPLFMAEEGSWGVNSSLEAQQMQTPVSLDIVCQLPRGGGVYGYKVKMCQNPANPNCNAGTSPNSEYDFGNGLPETGVVQVSGIECSPYYPGQPATRSGSGISAGATGARIFCPIPPPSDDSREHFRTLRLTQVYYSGGTKTTNCVDAGTCPKCRLRWWDRTGAMFHGSYFTLSDVVPSNRRAVWQGFVRQNIGAELAMGVDCNVPGGVTIQGVTAWASTTEISGGT